MTKPQFDVLGIGNAIVDVLSFSTDAFIEEFKLRKGTMILVDEARAEFLYQHMGPATEVSGGSAANTLAGIASLGGRASFIGKVKDDELGRIFGHDMRAIGVHYDTPVAEEGKATARCLIFVTPDAQRTMNTYIGACTQLSEADIDEELVKNSAITYVEGYMYCDDQTKRAIRKAVKIAKEAGRKVAFTPSDIFCIENHHKDFVEMVEQCDLLFANEEEIKCLYGAENFEQAQEAIRGKCAVAVLTRGALGSVVVTENDTVPVPAAPVKEVVDTTGAGDLYAAGFLYGYVRGWSLSECARLGGRCAGEIIQQIGARSMRPLSNFLAA